MITTLVRFGFDAIDLLAVDCQFGDRFKDDLAGPNLVTAAIDGNRFDTFGKEGDDFDVLREDAGMAAMLGYEPPSPAAARKFPCQFHDQETIEQAQQHQLDLARASSIPAESEPLAGLAAVTPDVVGALGDPSVVCDFGTVVVIGGGVVNESE